MHNVEKQSFWLCIFEEPTVTGGIFLFMMQNSARRHVPMKTPFSSYIVHLLTSPVRFSTENSLIVV
jgi:hypothetical protein